jgi:signal transduction histidine kinase
MFRKLRNKLILINLGITSVVIALAFTLIYYASTGAANRRPPMYRRNPEITENSFEVNGISEEVIIEGNNLFEKDGSFVPEVIEIVNQSIKNEKEAAATNLLITLIVSGITIELFVVIISFFLAEQAIKPIKESYETQKVFIANASHEIKTPLAAISANLEAADIKGNRWIDNIERETNKLSALNTELLALARADIVSKTKAEEVNVTKIVEDTLHDFDSRLKNIKVQKSIIKEYKAKIAAADFTQILSILFDNAVKYANKKIVIELKEHEFVIKNDGAKISAEALPHIFERFYQSDKSSEGVGLGLSIAKTVAERNHWELTAASKQLTSFTLKF